jgi:chromosome segregation protein
VSRAGLPRGNGSTRSTGASGAAADERARSVWALQEAEAAAVEAQSAKSAAELELRRAVELESEARQAVAAETNRGARLSALEEDLRRLEARFAETADELEGRARELEAAEAAFASAADVRRDAEDERRRLAEEAAAHRAEMETYRRSLASHDRERSRLEESLGQVRERRTTGEAEREALATDVERLDASTAPLGDRRSELERERHGLADKVAELEEGQRRLELRRDVLRARLDDLERTPGSRFVEEHAGRGVGLLGTLIHAVDGWDRALRAGLGALADAVVYEDADRALADAPTGEGATLAVAGGGPAAVELSGERTLLSIVDADPTVRGLASTLLKDIYLAETLEEAAAKHAEHPRASFVTPDGVLVGPALIRTTLTADSRAEEVRRELAVVERDLSKSVSALKPRRARLDEISGELAELEEAIEEADARITHAAERIARIDGELSSVAKEDEIFTQRLAGMDDAAAVWRESLAAAGPVSHELPELPRTPEPPIQARVSVETLRRERDRIQTRVSAVRAERDTLAAQDADTLRAQAEEATQARADAEQRLAAAETSLEAGTAARSAASAAERGATDEEAEVNRLWREASTELERLRETYEDQDRARGDLERRIRDAERVLREGHQREPEDAMTELSEDETVAGLERKAELVQRRLALLGRVNLLAGGEFEALQERHDFLHRELDDVRRARRDLLEVIQRIETEIVTTFEAAYRDVAAEFERLIGELFPGGEGRLVSTEPGDPLSTGIEIEARPGRKRVKRISLLSGGERALTALAFLFAIFKARPSPFYLMDEVEPCARRHQPAPVHQPDRGVREGGAGPGRDAPEANDGGRRDDVWGVDEQGGDLQGPRAADRRALGDRHRGRGRRDRGGPRARRRPIASAPVELVVAIVVGLVVLGIVLGVVLSRRRPVSRPTVDRDRGETTDVAKTPPAPTVAPRRRGSPGGSGPRSGVGSRTPGPSSRGCSSGPTSGRAPRLGSWATSGSATPRATTPRPWWARRSVRSSARPSRSACRPKGSA